MCIDVGGMPLPVQVILKDEDLDPAFDFREAAELADGYSGGCCEAMPARHCVLLG